MLGRGTHVAGTKGFFGALQLFHGFGGNVELADRNYRIGMRPRVCRTGSCPRVLNTERIGGIERGDSGVASADRQNRVTPGLRMKIQGQKKQGNNSDDRFHVQVPGGSAGSTPPAASFCSCGRNSVSALVTCCKGRRKR